MSSVHILGIRHHGPGSARSLRAALDELKPDAVLVEGPPDADALLSLAADADMQPPVALLIYAQQDVRQATCYPFAVYSPEYQAIRWALDHSVSVRFMDLPQTHQIAYPEPEKATPPTPDELTVSEQIRREPLTWLGRAAGYNDGERWWEHIIEQRRNNLVGVFDAVLEAMTELRESVGGDIDPREARREAYMRRIIRGAQRNGHKRIAVVCGAWHSPALVATDDPAATEQADDELLRDLPAVPVEATWIPWTYGRLARESGYGAGISSPGWYHHLWTADDDVVITWLTRVAALLREQDLDASTAQVIDTVRLTETLTAIRGYALPGLDELNESIQATMVFGAQEPMNLIHDALIVGERIGGVPPNTPMVPLQRDLRETRARLDGGARKRRKTRDTDQIKYFAFDPQPSELNLDLRAEMDLGRSHLLHRLAILGVHWGTPKQRKGGARGTFHEDWALQWRPEYEIKLIEQSIWGNTLQDAAGAFVIDRAKTAEDLPTLTRLVNDVLQADLPDAAEALISQLRARAALATDIASLMDALPPLAAIKTGHHARLSVRGVTLDDVADVIAGLLARININLVNACARLDDDAAEAMYTRLGNVHDAIMRLRNPTYTAGWYASLQKLTQASATHGLLAGRAARLLLDTNQATPEHVVRLMRLAISQAAEPSAAAAWVDGFLRGSGLILLHDDALFGVLDRWIASLNEQAFVALLPLLRRTFATFSGPERRQIGERVRRSVLGDAPADALEPTSPNNLDIERANTVLPILAQLLGLPDDAN